VGGGVGWGWGGVGGVWGWLCGADEVEWGGAG